MTDGPGFNAAFALTRSFHFIGCGLMLCVFVFELFMVDDETALQGSWEILAPRLFWISVLTALLTGTLWLIFVAASMSDQPLLQALQWQTIHRVLSKTHLGAVWKVRAVIGGITIATGIARWMGNWSITGNWAGLIFTACLMISLAWTGHGQTGLHPAAHLAADALHLVAAACWPVGLLPLAILLNCLRRSTNSGSIARLTRRFSAMSLACVAMLTVTGLVNSYLLIRSFHNLFDTSYGQMLLVKLTLLAVILIIAACNLFVLKPRLDSPRLVARSSRTLLKNVVAELSLATLLFLVVGLLGLLAPTPG